MTERVPYSDCKISLREKLDREGGPENGGKIRYFEENRKTKRFQADRVNICEC